MQHDEAVATGAAERYQLGEMSEQERHDFEAHFFECPVCAEDLRMGALLEEAVRADGSPAGFAAFPADAQAGRPPVSPKRWRMGVLVPLAAAAALVLVAGYQTLLVDRSPRELAAPQALTPVVLRPLSRGDLPIVSVGDGPVTLALDVNVAPGPAGLVYDLRKTPAPRLRPVRPRTASRRAASAPAPQRHPDDGPLRPDAARRVRSLDRDRRLSLRRPVARRPGRARVRAFSGVLPMDLPRRFVFRAHAVAIGGRMYRPVDCPLTSPATAALTVSGGISESRAKRIRCHPYVSAGEAIARVEGNFEDRAKAVAWTHGRIDEDDMNTVTTAFCAVKDLTIGRKRLRIDRLQAGLISRNVGGDRESSIRLAAATSIDGVAIDGFPLVVTLNRAPFETLDTRSKLVAAASGPRFARLHGQNFLMTTALGHRPAPKQPRLAEEGGLILATIVGGIAWKRRPHPTARIDGHVVVVPNFGRLYFGEMLIGADSRRLTLLRLQLGSPEGGNGTVTEVETNGSWYPPTS